MATKRRKPEEIVAKLRQVEVLGGQGMARVDAIREGRITEPTYHRRRKQHGGIRTDQLSEHMCRQSGFRTNTGSRPGWSGSEFGAQ